MQLACLTVIKRYGQLRVQAGFMFDGPCAAYMMLIPLLMVRLNQWYYCKVLTSISEKSCAFAPTTVLLSAC
jgi:hypothetical protein